jgi:hypothetical protein
MPPPPSQHQKSPTHNPTEPKKTIQTQKTTKPTTHTNATKTTHNHTKTKTPNLHN